mmetsp:Transcript_101800/g.180815  ORF Transcript_101800/g.180815 Transcript_101800/m.180815 type:complete len:692 (+) Transcript_101800:85-2160(+)
MASWCRSVLALCAIFTVASAMEEGPAEKVVKMMAKLKKEVVEQGEKEDAEFKAYAKFCATTLNEKAYQLKRSEEKNTSMTADKAVADEKISEAKTSITDLTAKVAKDQADLANATSNRADAAAQYAADAKEITDAMDALEKATAALSAAKKDIALNGMQSVVDKVLGTASRISLVELNTKQMSALEILGAPKASYNFRPTEVVAMLKGLHSTFTENKQRLDTEEEVSIGTFNKLKMNLVKTLKFTKEDLDDKILFKTKKEGESAQLEKDIAAETAAHTADAAFKADLEADCKAKDDMDKGKQTARENELAAIQTAIDKLAAGGVSFLQVESRSVQGGLKLKKTGSLQVNKVPAAFLQLRAKRAARKATEHSAAIAQLREMATKTGIAAASRLVERAATSGDPFVEVRKLFSELLDRMNAQAAEEATNNGMCKENVATYTTERDDMQAESETKTNSITALDAKLFKLNEEVKQLTSDVSEATASLEEATEQRADEHATFLSAKKEAEDGIDGSTLALNIMTAYYKKAALLQSSGPLDSSGKELHDYAKPEVNMGDYMAEAHERSAGVLGMLEVLQSDFERTNTSISAEEKQAVSDFDTLKNGLEADIKAKNDDIATKNGEIADDTVAKDQEETELETAQKRLELALEKLDSLRGICTENEESYATRRKKRQEEIDHLKKTVTLLDDLIEEGQ